MTSRNWSATDLATRLGARRSGSGWAASCPVHDDRDPSLSFNEGETGNVLVKCHAGCDQAAVWAAVEKHMACGSTSVPPETDPGNSSPTISRFGEIVAAYDYLDDTGRLLFQVVRDAGKQFRQRRPIVGRDAGEPAWIYNLEGVRRVLYRFPEVQYAVAMQREGKFAEPIFIVEGEKDANNIAALGLVATCNPGGAGKWRPEYTEALRGARKVVVLPDNDEPGRKHARSVAESLSGAVEFVAVLALPGLPDKGDVSDWIAAGGTKAELIRLAETTPKFEQNGTPGAGEAQIATFEPYSNFEPRAVSWLWPSYIPRGMLTVIDGDPGMGKSTLLYDLAARVSRGMTMPDGSGGGDPADVVLLSGEDDPNVVIRPRLDAAGADVERVGSLTFGVDGDKREPVISQIDIAQVEKAISSRDVVLIGIDPIVIYLPDEVNTDKDHSVRRALAPLIGLAERTGAAVVVVRHWRKSGAEKAIYRGGGSIGFNAAARSVLTVGNDRTDESGSKRVLAVAKCNLCPTPPSREFHLVSYVPGGQPRIEWGGVSRLSANELAAPHEGEKHRSAIADAEEFLLECLAEGEVRDEEITAGARDLGITEITLRRAKKRLKVTSIHHGGPGEHQFWSWALPAEAANQAQGAQRVDSIAFRAEIGVSPQRETTYPKAINSEEVLLDDRDDRLGDDGDAWAPEEAADAE